MMSRLIRIAHSPDADDAFMHHAVVTGRVAAEGLSFEETLADIDTLNQRAHEAGLIPHIPLRRPDFVRG